jgi:hypothetical protein
MPTPSQLKADIDEQITDKTQPYSISNVDVGERMKDIISLVELTVPIKIIKAVAGGSNTYDPVVGQSIYQNDDLINKDIDFIFVNKLPESDSGDSPDFVFDNIVGEIDRGLNVWNAGDTLLIQYR